MHAPAAKRCKSHPHHARHSGFLLCCVRVNLPGEQYRGAGCMHKGGNAGMCKESTWCTGIPVLGNASKPNWNAGCTNMPPYPHSWLCLSHASNQPPNMEAARTSHLGMSELTIVHVQVSATTRVRTRNKSKERCTSVVALCTRFRRKRHGHLLSDMMPWALLLLTGPKKQVESERLVNGTGPCRRVGRST